jgi:TraM recognition site of TraD and TraG
MSPVDRLREDQEESENAWTGTLPIRSSRLSNLLPALMKDCRFSDLSVHSEQELATATRRLSVAGPQGNRNKELFLSLRWSSSKDDPKSIVVSVLVYQELDVGRRIYERQIRDRLVASLKRIAKPSPAALETIVGPGEPIDGRVQGALRDYSGCAAPETLQDLCTGTLPLGRWAFGTSPHETQHGPKLFLSNYPNDEPMEYSSVLVCAPTGAGKTELLLRWARAANAAGYCTLIVDVKGNMLGKLGGLRGSVFRVSTNPQPSSVPSDRINFLREIDLRSNAGYGRIRQFAEVFLPSEGWRGAGGEEELLYQQRLSRFVAFVHLLKLRELYTPGFFGPRLPDLGDLYRLVTDERVVCEWIIKIREKEKENIAKGNQARMPRPGVDHSVHFLSRLLDPKLLPDGTRLDPRYGYLDHVAGIMLALEPFAPHGILYDKIRDAGPGHLFSLSELHRRREQEPTTVILETREQEGDAAWTLLSLALKGLQPLIFNRWNVTKAEREKMRPILLLLDETRRIRNFRADEFITVAREAAAGCVMVYQNLDQVVEQFGEPGLNTILENVGTQIYLRSLTGNTANHLIRLLPERYRTIETVNRADGSVQSRTEPIPYFTKLELAQLPAGRYPALVAIRGRRSVIPFLVDMDNRG